MDRNKYMREYRKTQKSKAYQKKFAASPKGRYAAQKSRSVSRGIDWLFTFESWWAMWEPHWDNRGTGVNDLQMCRNGDSGPYSPENCRIDYFRNNLSEMHERVWWS